MQVYRQTEGEGLYLYAFVGRWCIGSQPGSGDWKLGSTGGAPACPGDPAAGQDDGSTLGWGWLGASGNSVWDKTVTVTCSKHFPAK